MDDKRKRIWMALVALVAMTLLVVGCGRRPVKKSPSNGSPNGTTNGSTNGGTTSAACGNGTVDQGEACDSGIASGDGACPNTCQTPPGTCGTFELVGSADDCSARCELEPAACADGDDCCPVGCDSTTDGDCSNTCGNDVVEDPEVCDGDCPTTCDDGDACTRDTLNGSADACSATCEYDIVTACVDGDDCCPAGCGPDTDDDCSSLCGNGEIDDGETCDGDCPTSCDDQISCTRDTLSGSADNCSATCVSSMITSCTSGDGCCPAGCTSQTDNDCTCAPTTSCQALNFECGSVFNGCEDVSCGSCGANEICMNNRCEETFGIGEACTTSSGTCAANCIGEEGSGWDNGYCSRGCQSNSDCGPVAHCGLIDPETGSGACVLDCSSNADCSRSGYECFDYDDDGTRECAPTGSGNGDVGDPCDSFGDCGGGQAGTCYIPSNVTRNGYCLRDCNSDADCGAGAHCSDSLNTCLDSCNSDSDCRSTGYGCYDIEGDGRDECWQSATGSGDVGDACDQLWDCSGGQYGFCLTEDETGIPGGYCIETCANNSCPTGSSCITETSTGEQLCLDSCETSADCRSSYSCTTAGTPSDDVCWL